MEKINKTVRVYGVYMCEHEDRGGGVEEWLSALFSTRAKANKYIRDLKAEQEYRDMFVRVLRVD